MHEMWDPHRSRLYSGVYTNVRWLMARTDLQEHEISQLARKAQRVIDVGETWSVSKLDADRLLRLTGEVIELRNRESHVRQIQGLEDEY